MNVYVHPAMLSEIIVVDEFLLVAVHFVVGGKALKNFQFISVLIRRLSHFRIMDYDESSDTVF